MIVNMVFVKMSGNNYLIFAPHFLCQLHTDFVRRFTRMCFCMPAPISAASLRPRRHKLHIVHFRASTKSSLILLLLFSPKSHSTFRGPRLFSQNHIPFRRSFSCNRLILDNKKAGTFDVPTKFSIYLKKYSVVSDD